MNDNKIEKFSGKFKWLVLFTTSTCLVCCALPILLVSLGMGAVMATLVSSVPLIITISQHKIWTFIVSGILLAISAYFIYRPGRFCPTDPVLKEQCDKAHVWNQRILWVSFFIWAIGFVSAYILPLLEL